MKSKIRRIILSMPIAFLPMFLTVACSSQVADDKTNKEKLVKEVKAQFADSYKTSLKNFHPHTWKEKMNLQFEHLGVAFKPSFKHPIDILYYVEKVNLEQGVVGVKAEILYEKQFADHTLFTVSGFKTKKHLIEEDIDNFLKSIKGIMMVKNNNVMASDFKISEVFFQIKEIDLKGINFQINYNKILANDEEGTLSVEIIAKKASLEKRKAVLIQGFLTNSQIVNNIKQYLQKEAFDFEEKITSDATWENVLEAIIDKVQEKFDKQIVDKFEWEIENPKQQKIWGAQNLDSTVQTAINFNFKNRLANNLANITTVHFKNVKLNENEKEIYHHKNLLESIFEKEIASNEFETRIVRNVKWELEKQEKWKINELESILGIKISDEIKDKVDIWGTFKEILDNKGGKDYETIVITIEIIKNDLSLKVAKELWVTFKN